MYPTARWLSAIVVVGFDDRLAIATPSTIVIEYSNHMDIKRSSQLKKHLSVTLLCFVSALVFISCSSSKEVESLSVEDRFAQAMHKFKEGDYLDAIEDFKIVTVQFPGSAVCLLYTSPSPRD